MPLSLVKRDEANFCKSKLKQLSTFVAAEEGKHFAFLKKVLRLLFFNFQQHFYPGNRVPTTSLR